MPWGLPLPPPGIGSSPEQVEQLPISPYASQLGQPAQGAPNPALRIDSSLPPPPEHKQSFLSKMLPLLPTLASGALGVIGGPDSAIGNFGAGGAAAGSKLLLQDALRKHQEESEANSNRMQNVANRMEKIRRLASTDQRYAAVSQAYEQALADGKYDAKEAANVQSMMDALPDPETTLKNQEYSGALKQHEAMRTIDEKLARQTAEEAHARSQADKVTVDINGQPVKVSPDAAYREQLEAPERARQAKYQDAQIANMAADNRRQDAQFNALYGNQDAKHGSDADIQMAADALASGQARSLSEAMSMIGSARQRGDAGARIMAAMADRVALPPNIRQRVGEINISLDMLEQVRSMIDGIQAAKGPQERVEKSLLFDNFLSANAAAVAAAMGEKGVKTEHDIRRALSLTPGWMMSNVAPSLAYKKLDTAKERFNRNKVEVVRPYTMQFTRGNLGGASTLPAPPGMPAEPGASSGRFQILEVK